MATSGQGGLINIFHKNLRWKLAVWGGGRKLEVLHLIKNHLWVCFNCLGSMSALIFFVEQDFSDILLSHAKLAPLLGSEAFMLGLR